MALDHTDTTQYPAFSGATAKQDLLRLLQAEMEPYCPNWKDVIFRVNNTDLTGMTDGATVYDPAGTFAA